MEKEFRKLSLRPSKIDLSTIHENDISRENLKLLHKQQLLAKYIDKEARENTDDFDGEEFDFSTTDGDQQAMDFDRIVRDKVESQNREKTFKVSPNRLKSAMKTPTSNHFLTLNKDFKSPRIDSISSSSSKTSSSINSYSESDTENSDYMADFDEFQDPEPEIDLIKNFNRRQMEAKRAAELARLENLAKYKKMKNNVLHNNNRLSKYYDKVDNDFIDDFSKDKAFESVEIDTSKLDRFKSNTPAFSALERKSSLPAIKMGMSTGLEGSPRKIHRFSSTMDINNNTYNQKTFTPADTLRVASELKAFNGKELDNIDDFDLTITYSDYKKLKRKSQKFDLSKYTEPTSHRNHNHHHRSKQQNSDQKLMHLTPQNVSQTAKLTKEGKLKLIRSLGRPKVRKVMPGHMYGEIVYDPQLKKWMGNEEDAEKFESITSSKPKLINNNSMPQVVGNMIYDDKKLRWISMTGSYEDDPFDEDFDTTIKLTEKKASTKIGKGTGGSAFGRLVPSESTISISENLKNPNNHFRVHPDMYKSWKNEEERWVRKVGNWFPNDEHAHEFKYDLKIFLNQQ